MRYTQYRGLAQVSNWVKLKFAAMNLKKLAGWLWMEKSAPFALIFLCLIYTKNPAYASGISRVFRQPQRPAGTEDSVPAGLSLLKRLF